MDQLTGQILSHYRLDKVLSEGGMGIVYKATDVTLQRPVAVKVMHSQFARQPHYREQPPCGQGLDRHFH